ncbi:sensor histidine kinase [Microlunatus soli]|uniref:histidine kinase n=1 Tax=Microlunatus soli TaxID=630515 RepID=A0A1H1VIT3_9ACTN|nr:HAMP domain-containing sensor histidine kinase [Microlunatus soli]SDS84625.1 two-component system, OmpR family, sensor kinase [Microlunatus soli]
MTENVPQPTASGVPAPTAAREPGHGAFGRGTLGRQLLLRVVAIVAAIAILLSGASLLATQQLLLHNVDGQFGDVFGRLRGPGATTDRLVQPGQPQGTLYALYVDGDAVESGMLEKPKSQAVLRRTSLNDPAIDVLSTMQPDDSYRTVHLDGLGSYRVTARTVTAQDPTGTSAVQATLVVGLSLSDVNSVLRKIIQVAIPLSLLAILAATVAVGMVVRRSLRPLNRVATTAQQVSQLQLDRGEVALAMRVPPADSDPASEVGRVGQALNHMLDNVDGALAARQASETKLKRFIADASHELRNPLASIRGYAELTRRGRDQLPTDTAFALGRVESEATRMSRLVEDLLLLARLDSGPGIEVGPVDLTELLINAVSDARVAGRDHQWVLDLDGSTLPDRPVVATGDRYRLHQAVLNLLANARTHTPAGTTVRVGLRVDGPTAVITVADDGPGIAPQIQGQVFERFTRADSSRARAGDGSTGSTGLGLAIVAAVVEAHHGTVGVRSVPGDTRFVINLPLEVRDLPSTGTD